MVQSVSLLTIISITMKKFNTETEKGEADEILRWPSPFNL